MTDLTKKHDRKGDRFASLCVIAKSVTFLSFYGHASQAQSASSTNQDRQN
jgi:tellurite resistance-related uncharacterized protein